MKRGRCIMTHCAPDVMTMQNASKGFGGSIRRIDNARKMSEGDERTGLPFLNSKMLDVDMACAGVGRFSLTMAIAA